MYARICTYSELWKDPRTCIVPNKWKHYRPHADLFTDHMPTSLQTTYRTLYRPHTDILTDYMLTS